ncbi:hypothetical protein [Desulfopila aestuarii]|uniref:Uncharacterized protein n=1 Tax=Desulfopila aestuarii DSM 18488 TaxID=1121416 RepID=A0A1M7YE46_9BACT|nr:hypothetical protein [Desulfopila aestuarii]SHO50907.1 hypothetical protein SAMN02745220_03699 [Desulfopila aestuarii DSM 18488]
MKYLLDQQHYFAKENEAETELAWAVVRVILLKGNKKRPDQKGISEIRKKVEAEMEMDCTDYP